MPATIVTGYETSPSVSLYNTVTGKNRILTNGAVVAPATCGSFCDPNPRTAAGLTSGNSKLILMTVDGRDEGVSDGATLVDLAGFMAKYGATNAINLDGGGSTQMAANYYNDGANAKLVNVPSEAERSVGTNLASSPCQTVTTTRTASSTPATMPSGESPSAARSDTTLGVAIRCRRRQRKRSWRKFRRPEPTVTF